MYRVTAQLRVAGRKFEWNAERRRCPTLAKPDAHEVGVLPARLHYSHHSRRRRICLVSLQTSTRRKHVARVRHAAYRLQIIYVPNPYHCQIVPLLTPRSPPHTHTHSAGPRDPGPRLGGTNPVHPSIHLAIPWNYHIE